MDEDKLDQFKNAAIEMGYSQDEVNNFLGTVNKDMGKGVGDIIPSQGSFAPSQENFIPTQDSFTDLATSQGFSPEETSSFMDQPTEMKEMSAKLQPMRNIGPQSQGAGIQEIPDIIQPNIVGSEYKITTPFGARSSADVFSKGRNWGVDIAVGFGTPVSAPPGEWEVMESYGGASPNGGYIGNPTNQGYGNSTLIKNKETGETIRFSHLSKVGVEPGEVISDGKVFGYSGNSGNSSASHLDVEYRNESGYLADILSSPYGKYL